MTTDEFFYEHSVFRHDEFFAWKSAASKITASSVNTALRYYVKIGRIKQIKRGLYAVIPPNQTSESLFVDPYILAGKITDDAVLGYHTALELMGMAYSTFGQFTYLTEHKHKPFEFQEQWFQPVSVPLALKNSQTAFLYVEAINRQGATLKITNKERTYVDILDRIELCGGWEEVCRAINHFAVLDIDKVIQYCLSLNNSRLNAKVGYFLSQRTGAFAVEEKQLKKLLKAIPKIAQYASKRNNEPFQLIKRWNIMLPTSVIHQSWEEPNV